MSEKTSERNQFRFTWASIPLILFPNFIGRSGSMRRSRATRKEQSWPTQNWEEINNCLAGHNP
jgi:hypothetical protein